MLPLLEPSEAGGFLDEVAALLGPGGEDLLDPALSDDRVHRAAEPEVGEQLDEVEPPDCRAIHEVLALPTAMEPAGDRQLAVFERAVAGAVVEEELDLAEFRRPAATGAGIQDVVRLLRPELGRRQ